MKLTNPRRIEAQMLNITAEVVVAEHDAALIAMCKDIIMSHNLGFHTHTYTGKENSRLLAEMATHMLNSIKN